MISRNGRKRSVGQCGFDFDTSRISGNFLKVVSRFLCKRFERVLIPVNVHTVKDAIKDAFTTAAGGEGTHR
ncbi:MAG: hypothetical protein ACLQUR_08625, partial [Limisphaerales bacterium]